MLQGPRLGPRAGWATELSWRLLMAAYERQERRHLLPWQLQPATCKPGSRASGQTLCLKSLR